MNELIKEFEKQSWDHQTWHLNTEKFAELIIQDCITTVHKRYMGDNNREDMEVLRCVSELKNRFGVKE